MILYSPLIIPFYKKLKKKIYSFVISYKRVEYGSLYVSSTRYLKVLNMFTKTKHFKSFKEESITFPVNVKILRTKIRSISLCTKKENSCTLFICH